MDKVLNLTHRLQDKRRKEQIEVYREKFDTVQRILHCSGCQYKCAMCGYHIETTDAETPTSRRDTEFNLCDSCASEYEDFKRRKQGKMDDAGPFWHTDDWMAFWTAWCEYQRSINRFRHTFNLKQLEDPSDE